MGEGEGICNLFSRVWVMVKFERGVEDFFQILAVAANKSPQVEPRSYRG